MKTIRKQSGVALVLSLLLLLVMIIIGAATMSNTHMQERMAGNSNLQSIAFEAASAGATEAVSFFDAHRDLGADELCGTSGHTGWENPTAWVDRGTVGGANLRQRMYCLADEYPDEDAGRPPRSQLFVLSRGEVISDGVPVAVRDIEVRLVVGSVGAAGDGCGALCFPACSTGTLSFPTSNAFTVDGGGGPAITAGCQQAATNILNAIRSNRIGNYIGGIAAATSGSPWNDPAQVELFRANVALSALTQQASGTCTSGACYNAGNVSNNGNSTYGTAASPRITYINGNATFGGNISGAGILVVKGNLSWSGTPAFQGLIVVLGGTFNLTGGGHGGNHAGALIVMNTQGGSAFGNANFTTTGGGTADFNFSCDALWNAHDLLNDAGQGMWSPECDVGPQSPNQAGPEELSIASWRENLGWREATLTAAD